MHNYLFPFLWITGESTDGLAEEIDAIYESGARGFCVESRTCGDFCGEKWWTIMNAVLAEAKARGMQVWLLDDKHYPTGFANGAIEKKRPELRPWRIKCEFVDLEGEAGGISLLLNSASDKVSEDEILGVFSVKKREESAKIVADLSDCVCGDVLSFFYDGKPLRICTVKKTRGCSEDPGNPYYLDMLNPDSVDVLIREVYEPHYERYVKSGKYADTFCGFFSDEPRFHNGYNCADLSCGYNAYQSTLGIEGMSYPWCDGLSQNFAPRDLLSLWWNASEDTPYIRIAYMDAITRSYGANFSGRLSEWCHARNLTYCGHIIEDMGAHARLGCSAGHYFRSQQGADYAAIDVVLHQIKPNYIKKHFAPIAGGYSDPVFFDNTLAKLASSCARLYPEKNNRALCEIFGAYGWGESISEMLYLVNHMLVRGINSFIPHAYSQRFPNADCPPHFGKNTPLFGGYKLVMRYMQKMCELFAGERAEIKVGILYHAEAEWSGKRYMPVDTVAAMLAAHQIDYDILPSEKLDQADQYEYIIVPYAEFLSEKTERTLQDIPAKKVLRLKSNTRKELIALADCLPHTLKMSGTGAKRIRVIKFFGKAMYFLHNEGSTKASLQIEFFGQACRATDALCDTEEILSVKDGSVNLKLRAGQAVFLSVAENEAEKSKCKTQDIPFERTDETDDSVTYSAVVPISVQDELRIEYAGEWARIEAGGKKSDSIGGVARISGVKAQEINITVYKNLGLTIRDDLSKFDILRPATLKAVQIKRNWRML